MSRSLKTSKPIGFALPMLGLLLGLCALDLLATWPLAVATPSRLLALLWLLGWPLLLWGLWRLGVEQLRSGTLMQRLAFALLALWLLLSLVLRTLPHAPQAVRVLAGLGEPLQFKLLDGGRTLALTGPIRAGDAARLAEQLAAQPTVLRLQLQSTGGPLPEWRAMAEQAKARALGTRVVDARCERGCTLLFLAGQPRQLMGGAQLAFQRLQAPTLNPLWQTWLSQAQANRYAEQGLPANLQAKQRYSVEPLLWQPTAAELRADGLLPLADQALAIDLPPPAGALPAEYEAALRAHPSWQALMPRDAALSANAVAQLQSSHGGSAPGNPDAAQLALQGLAMDQLQTLAALSSDPMRQQLLQWLAEALKTPGLDCPALLALDSATHRRLPAPLSRSLAQWLEDAANEVREGGGGVQQPLNRLEAEVSARSLGRASGLLSRLWPGLGQSSRALACEPARELVLQIQELQPAQRRLVLRRLFARG